MTGFAVRSWGDKKTDGIKDYRSAEEYLNKGRSKEYRPLECKTSLTRLDNDDIAVKYHDTNVVTYHPDGSATLRSGGWMTKTTKQRMNDYTHYRIDADKGVWYVDGDVYQDGMTLLDGVVDYHGDAPSEKEILGLRKSVAEYAKRFAENLPGLGLPDGGDCWFCYFSFGDSEPQDTSHLLSHIEEDYFVPSLAIKAIKESGWGDYLGYGIQEMMRDGESWGRLEHHKSDLTRIIRKYIQKRLGLSVG